MTNLGKLLMKNTSTSLDTDIDYWLEATKVLSHSGLRLEATGISTSAYIS